MNHSTHAHWDAHFSHKPQDRSAVDRVLTSPVTFAIALGLLCAMPVLAFLIR